MVRLDSLAVLARRRWYTKRARPHVTTPPWTRPQESPDAPGSLGESIEVARGSPWVSGTCERVTEGPSPQ